MNEEGAHSKYICIKSKHKKAAKTLLKLINNNPEITHLFDEKKFSECLSKIISIDNRVKTNNPSIYCYYEYQTQYGYFKADCIVKLSTYILHLVCQSMHYYNNAFGEGSTLFFKIDDVEISYDEEKKSSGKYTIDFNQLNTEYEHYVWVNLEEELINYMNSLEPLYKKEFPKKRHDDLIEYAENILSSRIRTNNPILKLSINVPIYEFSLLNYCEEFNDEYENIKLTFPLSKVMTLIFHKTKIDFNTSRPQRSNKIFFIDDVKINPTSELPESKSILTDIWKNNSSLYEITHAKILDVLNSYPKLQPDDFFNKYYEEIKHLIISRQLV